MESIIHSRWSVKIGETVISKSDSKGYHPELIKRWAYVPGMMQLAFGRLWELTGNEAYYDFMKRHMDLFVLPGGGIKGYLVEDYNLDQVNQGKALFPLLKRTGQEHYAQAAHLLADQLAGQPRTSEGGFWHKKIYPFQMWLDGLYMSSPFLSEYAKVFDRPELYGEVARQLLLVEAKTRDPETGLLYHGWDESREQYWCDPATGKSRHFWSRAMGWYAMAVVDSLEHFPVNHPSRGTIVGIFERMCRALEQVQDPQTGLWYQVLDRAGQEGNYLEASGSCMFIYAMAKGVRLHYLSKPFKDVADKGYAGLIRYLVKEDDEGVHLNEICTGAGLGGTPYRDGSYSYYISEPKASDIVMGVAPFLFACIEMESTAPEAP